MGSVSLKIVSYLKTQLEIFDHIRNFFSKIDFLQQPIHSMLSAQKGWLMEKLIIPKARRK